MADIQTDYLVVGAGASGMAFVDALLAADPDADVVIVDRRHRPGGHWLDAYPFVRLHQPSANYGVPSRPLGTDRVDDSGTNTGFYERATAAEICDYFNRVMDEHLLPSGRVRFLPMHDYRGDEDGSHRVVSLLSGEPTTVTVRRKLVDATYVESSIPSRHTPKYAVDDGVRLVPPNDLVDLREAPSGFTVIGAGKTAMDTCVFLIESGVDPARIRWIKPRDVWMFARGLMQPLDQVGSYMQLQASWVDAAAHATGPDDFAHRLEAAGVLVRVDPDVEPQVFRGPIISDDELEKLRRITDVVRLGYVKRIGPNEIVLEGGSVATDPDQIYVDCTAHGVPVIEGKPVFEPGKITLQYVTVGIVPLSAATIGVVEALRDDDAQDEKNRLCPPVIFTGSVAQLMPLVHAAMAGILARGSEPDIAAWYDTCRLNPARGATDRFDDPRVVDAFTVIGGSIGEAMRNLERLAAAAVS